MKKSVFTKRDILMSKSNRERLKDYFIEIQKYPLLTGEEEIALAEKIKNGDQKAKEKLINSNLRIVITIAKQFTFKDDLLEDAIEEGNYGLIIAASKFDSSFNVRFQSYAAWWIKDRIVNFLKENSGVIRLSPSFAQELTKYRKFQENFMQKNERPANYEETLEFFGDNVQLVDKILQFTDYGLNLELDNPEATIPKHFGIDGTSVAEKTDNLESFINFNITEQFPDSEKLIVSKESIEKLINGIKAKFRDDRDREIFISYIKKLYELDDEKTVYSDISESYNLTIGRIKQIVQRFKFQLNSRGFKMEDYM